MDNAYLAWATQCVSRSGASSLTFAAWDILTTLDDEVECIWRRPFSWSKGLFVFIRYYALLVQIARLFIGTGIVYSPAACYGLYIFSASSFQLFISSVEVISMLRVHALYSHNMFVRSGTTILFLIEFTVIVVCVYKIIRGMHFDDGCIITYGPKEVIGFGVAVVGFESLLLALMLAKFIQALRFGWGHTEIMRLLISDGTGNFIIICLILLINSVAYCAVSGPLSGVGGSWVLAIVAYAGCRLLLNMHRLATPEALHHAGMPSDFVDSNDTAFIDTHLDFSIGTLEVRESILDANCARESTMQKGLTWNESGIGRKITCARVHGVGCVGAEVHELETVYGMKDVPKLKEKVRHLSLDAGPSDCTCASKCSTSPGAVEETQAPGVLSEIRIALPRRDRDLNGDLSPWTSSQSLGLSYNTDIEAAKRSSIGMVLDACTGHIHGSALDEDMLHSPVSHLSRASPSSSRNSVDSLLHNRQSFMSSSTFER